jgi:hypothetical protein
MEYVSRCEWNPYAGAKVEWIPFLDESLMPAQKLNAIKIKRNAKYISHVGWKSYASSKVECNHKSKKYQLHVSFWIKILRRFKGWAHSTIHEVFNTSLILNGIFMPVQCLNEFKILEMVNTALFWWSLTPAQKLNAIKIQRNSKYILHVGWKSYAGSKTECNHKSRNYQLHVWFSIKILTGSKVKWIRYQRNTKYISHCSWRSRKDFQNTVGAVQKTWFVTVFVFVLRAACTRREWSQ